MSAHVYIAEPVPAATPRASLEAGFLGVTDQAERDRAIALPLDQVEQLLEQHFDRCGLVLRRESALIDMAQGKLPNNTDSDDAEVLLECVREQHRVLDDLVCKLAGCVEALLVRVVDAGAA